MKTRKLACIALIVSCSCLHGCASTRLPFPTRDMITTSEIPPADPALDHYVAWIPGDVAETATVARAMTHISLGRARDEAGRELCEGDRLIPGEVASVIGPIPTAAPDGTPVWYYRISQQPGVRGCSTATESQLFQAVQNNLPPWISIERAGAAYHALGLLQ